MKSRKKFTHLDHKKRDRIEALWRAGEKQARIAEILKVDKSTVSREIARRSRVDGWYDADTAEHKARVKRSNSKHQGMKIERYPELRDRIIGELKAHRAPDEIAGRMKKDWCLPRVGTAAIYKWLYSPFGQAYCRYLCTKRYRRKPQPKEPKKREMIPNATSIAALPEEAKNGTRYGHFEGDTFLSPKKAKTTACVAVVVEKKTKLILGRKLPNQKPEEMRKVVVAFSDVVAMKTLTLDRGIENRHHERFGVPAYFCDPHAPWQKPLVEGSIGLLRRWFWKKGTDLSKVTEEEFQEKFGIMNDKYRRSLNYRSAAEAARERDMLESD